MVIKQKGKFYLFNEKAVPVEPHYIRVKTI